MSTDTTSLQLEKVVPTAEDFLPLLGTDYVELYVGNAKQAAHYYMSAWGYQPLAYAGLETGMRDRVSYVLQQDKIRLVITSPLITGGEINEHINKHGDGVKVIALHVDDAAKSWEETTKRGGESYMEPTTHVDENGKSGYFRYSYIWRNTSLLHRKK
jgi:4-hydroxyphenylpyruvate dioxygenase